MRVIVVGLGVQGRKRARFADNDLVATVDPVVSDADVQQITDIPIDNYDAALLCVPDEAKIELLNYLLENGKHALVEKPLWSVTDGALEKLQKLAKQNKAYCYTAYNHRFEPHFIRMRDLIRAGTLGKIYRCRLFYGNGTARLVRESAWRDQGAGVLTDLGSHLLDTISDWFGCADEGFRVISANMFENRAFDHVVVGHEKGTPKIELEMTLLSWRNDFTCDIFAENGSAHIRSLCKWGPSSFTLRRRVLPSGRPPEETVTIVEDDPTWEAEYEHFKRACALGTETDLVQDIWLQRTLVRLANEADGTQQR
jgi:scyllo-inositol 2-dehydrogenase (NADP+)